MTFAQWEVLWQLEQLERHDNGDSFVPEDVINEVDESVEVFCEEYFARG